MVGHSAWAGHTGGHSTAGRHARRHHGGHHRGGSLRAPTGTYRHLQALTGTCQYKVARTPGMPLGMHASGLRSCVPASLRSCDGDDAGGGLNLPVIVGLEARQTVGPEGPTEVRLEAGQAGIQQHSYGWASNPTATLSSTGGAMQARLKASPLQAGS